MNKPYQVVRKWVVIDPLRARRYLELFWDDIEPNDRKELIRLMKWSAISMELSVLDERK